MSQAIAASLEVNRTIRKVDLSGNSIGVEGAQVRPMFLVSCEALSDLSPSRPLLCQALLAALRNNRRVKIVLDKDHFSRYSKEAR